MISRLVSSSPALGSTLAVQSLLGILSLFLSALPSLAHTLSLKINKLGKKKNLVTIQAKSTGKAATTANPEKWPQPSERVVGAPFALRGEERDTPPNASNDVSYLLPCGRGASPRRRAVSS